MDGAQLVKIGIIVVCLGGAGFLFAWQSGMLSAPPKDTRSQEQIQEEEDQFQQQERMREKMKSMPQYQQGDA